MIIDAPEGTCWVTVAEAAAALGVSTDTVKRRLRCGALHRRHTAGGRVLVGLPEMPAAPQAPESAPQATPHVQGTDGAADALLTRLEAITAERDWLRERVERAESEREQLRMLLGAAVQVSARALHAAPQVPDPEPAPDPFPEPIPPTPNAAPWWRRWWLVLAGSGLVLAVAGSSCQAGGFAASHQNLCPAAHQHLAIQDMVIGNGRQTHPEDIWLLPETWRELKTVAAFIKDYC